MTAPSITLYSKPARVQCTATKRHLETKGGFKEGMHYRVINISVDEAAYDHIKAVLGFPQAPAVVFTDRTGRVYEPWSGYRPGLLD